MRPNFARFVKYTWACLIIENESRRKLPAAYSPSYQDEASCKLDSEGEEVLANICSDSSSADEVKERITEYLNYKMSVQHKSLVLQYCLKTAVHQSYADTGASFDMHHPNLREAIPVHEYRMEEPH